MAAGVAIVFAISAIPANRIVVRGNMWNLLLIGGVSAVALILPGISISHWFLILGLYEEVLQAVHLLDITFLVPLGAGVLLGTVLFSRLLEWVMEKYPKATYLVILGFILGSVASIFPGIPSGIQIVLCAGMAISGFLLIYKSSQNASN